MRVTYVHVETGAIEHDECWDPGMGWTRTATGDVFLFTTYGVGEPLPWWLAENPKPRP